MSAAFDTSSDEAVALLRKAIAAFPEDWDMEGVHYVEFHKTMTAMYAQNAETLIVYLDPRYADAAEQDITLPADHLITDVTSYSEDTLFKAAAAAEKYTDPETANDIINEMLNAGILFREHGPDQEEHTHYSNWANRVCAVGDHEGAESLDRDAEREKMRENEEATMAEEPIEERLRRQWLNGYMMGFREGFERAGWLGRAITGE